MPEYKPLVLRGALWKESEDPSQIDPSICVSRNPRLNPVYPSCRRKTSPDLKDQPFLSEDIPFSPIVILYADFLT